MRLVERVDVVGGAETGCPPRLFAETFGQAFLQLLHAGSHTRRALLRVE
jgi:hypothetical protein